MRDLRYALRTLSRNPGLSLAVILVLALGIGANSAIFTVVRAVLLAPLPYQDPDHLVRLFEYSAISSSHFNVVSAPNFNDWKAQSNSFESMGYMGDWGASFSPSDGGLPEILQGSIVDSGFFPTMGVAPEIGRYFREEEDRPDAQRVVVISHRLWQQRFAGNRAALNTSIRLDGELYTVIGVMPASFDYPPGAFWLPVGRMLNYGYTQQRGNHRFNAVGRLKPGVSLEQAQTELDGIQRRIKQQYPDQLVGNGATVTLFGDRLVARVRPMLLVLLGAVACVLLIACVNVTNLLLSRAISRRREIAVRAALGAGRAHIVRQFLTESLLLSLAGAMLGFAFAAAGTGVLVKMAGAIPRIDTVHVNWTVVAFTAAIALLTGIAVGLVPALTSSGRGLAQSMQDGGRSSTAGRSRGLFRDAMICAEVALSLMLLIGAGLMLKSFARLRAVDPGFNPDRLLTIRLSLPSQRYKTPAQVASFFRDMLDRVRGIPGVESAGFVSVAPLQGHYMDNSFTIDGHPPLPTGHFLDAVVRVADPAYFKSAGIPVKRGRVFTAADWLASGDKAVISEGMAATFFPNEDPIGKRIRTSKDESWEIVGVVGDARQNLAVAPEPTMYFPAFQGGYSWGTLMIRAAGDPNLLSLPVQKKLREMDSDMPAVTVKTMDEIMSGSTQQNRFGLTLIALFAGLAVLLSSIGLYGVLAYSVGQRTSEIGVRIALGAGNSAIAKLVVWQGLRPALAGIVAGAGGAFAATRLLQSMLYEVSPTDPGVLAAVIALLVTITLAACFIPAWRASRIDPVIALRVD